jgi:hypothetical protein
MKPTVGGTTVVFNIGGGESRAVYYNFTCTNQYASQSFSHVLSRFLDIRRNNFKWVR